MKAKAQSPASVLNDFVRAAATAADELLPQPLALVAATPPPPSDDAVSEKDPGSSFCLGGGRSFSLWVKG